MPWNRQMKNDSESKQRKQYKIDRAWYHRLIVILRVCTCMSPGNFTGISEM